MPRYEDIVDICASYTGSNYFVLDLIPARKLANARARYPIPGEEPVVALIDTTAFGSAKTGVAICQSGIYWRNQAGERKYSYIAWENVDQDSLKAKGRVTPRIELGPDILIELLGGGIGKEQVANLFSEISALPHYDDSSDGDEPWMLAVHGKQLGPYSNYDLESMARAKMYDPNVSFVWREGMKEWIPIREVPELHGVFEAAHVSERSKPPPPSNAPDALDNFTSTSKRELSTNVTQHSDRRDHQSLVDINKAATEEMLHLPTMNLGNAEKLVAARRQRGGFREIEEVGQLLGLKPHEVERLRKATLIGPRPQGTASGRIVDF